MATDSKPQAYPTWTNGEATQVAAPSPSQQASGFTEGQRPSYQLLNWLFWLNGQWAQHLDAQATTSTQYIVKNPLVRLIGGGLWSYDAGAGKLAWSQTAYLAVPGALDEGNALAAGSVSIAVGQVAYVQINQGAQAAGNLQVLVADSKSLVPDQNTVIIARCTTFAVYSTQVMVGVNAGQMMVKPGEQKALLGSGYVAVDRIKAGQALTAYQAVYVSTGATGGRTAGSVYPADAGSASGATRAKAYGITIANCQTGDDAAVVTSGIVNGLTGLVPGGLVYIDPATPGAVTQTLPTTAGTYVVPIGLALSATQMRINPSAAEMALALQNGQVVNGPLTVNGLSTFKPGATGKTLTLYNANGQTVVGTVDDTGAAVFAASVTTAQVQATTAIRSPSFVSTTGFKSDVLMGYSMASPGANNQAPLLVASNTPRVAVMRHAGSVVGISLSQYSGSQGSVSVSLTKNNASFVVANNVAAGLAVGGSSVQTGYLQFAKGTYSFAAGDQIQAKVSLSNGDQHQISVDITVEYAA